MRTTAVGLLSALAMVSLGCGTPPPASEPKATATATVDIPPKASTEVATAPPAATSQAETGPKEEEGVRADSDRYQALGENNVWEPASLGASDGNIGRGIVAWSKGRLLELRSPEVSDADYRLPIMRVLKGTDKIAPALPAAIAKRMQKEGYWLETYKAFPTGEFIAIGKLHSAEGYGTVVWRDNPRQPVYFVTKPKEPLTDEDTLTILGGTSLADARLCPVGPDQSYDRRAGQIGVSHPLDMPVS